MIEQKIVFAVQLKILFRSSCIDNSDDEADNNQGSFAIKLGNFRPIEKIAWWHFSCLKQQGLLSDFVKIFNLRWIEASR